MPLGDAFPLCGKPLIQYTLDAALASQLDDVVISTDDEQIAKLHDRVIMRPPELAEDKTPMLPVVQHAVKVYGKPVDAVMLLQPTSPLRTTKDIDNALELFKGSKTDSLVSVYEGVHPIRSYNAHFKPFMVQQPYDKHKHKCYTRNGAIFIAMVELIQRGKLIGDSPVFYIMPPSRSIDVDQLDHLYICESILRNQYVL